MNSQLTTSADELLILFFVLEKNHMENDTNRTQGSVLLIIHWDTAPSVAGEVNAAGEGDAAGQERIPHRLSLPSQVRFPGSDL